MGQRNSKNKVAAQKSEEFDQLHVLGRGAHSDVVAVEHRATKQRFAIKRIVVGPRKSLGQRRALFFLSLAPPFFFLIFFLFLSSGTDVEQAEFEAKTLCRLSHRNVVRAFDWWTVYDERGVVAAVHVQLEVCEGDLLSHVQALPTLRLSRGDAVAAARQLVSAAAFLHAHDVVHRDIKLQNVLVASSQPAPLCVKLSDLSLANSVADCAVWPSAGTICTKAPEGVRPHVWRIDGKSDVFSLGVTLFCAATGRYPFCAHTVARGDGHKCSACVDVYLSSSDDDDASPRIKHVCVSGTIEAALAALAPDEAPSAPLAALLTAMCQIDPAARPSAAECLHFEVMQFRLLALDGDKKRGAKRGKPADDEAATTKASKTKEHDEKENKNPNPKI